MEGPLIPRRRILLAAAFFGLTLSRPACARSGGNRTGVPPATVYAAFALKGALDDIIGGFAPDGRIRGVYGPSPALARQIEEGAPADLFISADPEWLDALAGRHLIADDSRVDLVRTTLVLAARADDAAARRLAIAPGFPLASALDGGRIAICDPMMNPAGKSARASLTTLGVWPAVASRVAPAENSGAALKLLESGAVPFAIVYASDLVGQSAVAAVGTFPDDTHPPIVFPAALTAASHNETARRFLTYLRSPPAAAIFVRYGFAPLPVGEDGQNR